ncbi:MAG: hypothetical protein ACOYYS_24245 [Chloroflexota bacterium]
MQTKPSGYGPWYLWLIPSAAILILLFLSIQISATPLPFRPFTLGEVLELLTGLLMIALFMERALEVFITTWRGPGTTDRESKVKEAAQELENSKAAGSMVSQVERTGRQTEVHTPEEGQPAKVEQSKYTATVSILSEAAEKEKQAKIEKATEALHEVKARLASYKSHTQRLALWTSLTFGIAISMAGVRSIQNLVMTDAFNGATAFQQGAFHVLDVLLTGGMIAGGSEGIHKITAVFTEFLEKTRDNIKSNPS